MPLYRVNHLTSEMKTNLIHAYDDYIQTANEENRYIEGWMPVSINEFLNCEFQEIIKDKGLKIIIKE